MVSGAELVCCCLGGGLAGVGCFIRVSCVCVEVVGLGKLDGVCVRVCCVFVLDLVWYECDCAGLFGGDGADDEVHPGGRICVGCLGVACGVGVLGCRRV